MKLILFLSFFLAVFAYDDDMTVYTVTAPWCGSECDEWQDMVNEVALEFPSVKFVTIDESVVERRMGTEQNLVLPMSIFAYNDTLYKFEYTKTKAHLRRWVKDGSVGIFSLLGGRETLLEREERFQVSITFFGVEEPVFVKTLASRMPSVGVTFMSTTVPGHNLGLLNVTLLKRFDGQVTQLNHHKPEFLHHLLPKVIKYDDAKHETVLEILRALSTSEVSMVSDDPIGEHWRKAVEKYPYTAFIQYRSDQMDIPSPSVLVYNRSLNFSFGSVGPESVDWYEGVRSGIVEPDERVSCEPPEYHPSLFDVTGNNAWDWVRNHDDAYMILYASKVLTECENAFENAPEHVVGGRMNISCNDHESLPEKIREGIVVRYFEGRIVSAFTCENFKFATNDTSSEQNETMILESTENEEL